MGLIGLSDRIADDLSSVLVQAGLDLLLNDIFQFLVSATFMFGS